jgi:acetyl-CoA carboxylase / biotin carboxylase 1
LELQQTHLHFAADPTAQGSVLEAEGLVEIKFRKPDLIALMRRMDPVLQDLLKRRAAGTGSSMQLDAAVHARQDALLPAYRAVALKFAEMHDTPV